MAERACRFAEVHVDFGTGDGVFAYRTARQQPSTLVIGMDANADGLREISRRALRKPARGGLSNVLFGRLSLEDTPGELVQLADAVSVLFPWGSLLRAVAVPEREALRKLARIGKPGARFRFLYGYGIAREARAVEELGLPALGGSSILRALEDGYADAGLQVEGRYVTREEIALNQTPGPRRSRFQIANACSSSCLEYRAVLWAITLASCYEDEAEPRNSRRQGMKRKFVARGTVAIGVIVGLSAIAPAYAGDVQDADETVKLLKKTDPGLGHFFKGSAGYAVFPNVGKGALGIGGAYGPGILYEHGKPVGKTTLTQVTIGLQMGGQAYAEIIFFETEKVLSNFKGGNFEFSGQVSAVAVRAGASANAKYRDGVAVFTATRGGLMFEASVGGQKFSYEPFAKKK